MKNKIICLLLALVMVFSVFAMTACGSKDNDGDGNGGNGDGGNTIPDGSPDTGIRPGDDLGDDWFDKIAYQTTSLNFKLTDNSNDKELSSGCRRYLAGEDDKAISYIDELVAARNEDALEKTNVLLTYSYYTDTATYKWSRCTEQIAGEIAAGSTQAPDMYCNFLTDMLSASLIASFANLYSRVRGDNFMNKEADGYMDDLMSSLTLSTDKIYIVASDYFLDLIRAFFVVPVNVSLYNGIAERDTNLVDYTKDGTKNIDDLFEEVKDMKWTYERVAQYSELVYNDDNKDSKQNIGDTVGFALSQNSGLSAAGMVYTSSVVIIHKIYDTATGDFNYFYPSKGDELTKLSNAINTLFSSTGVIAVDNQAGGQFGATSLQAIRQQFSTNKVLFGGLVLLGSLEETEYQSMKDKGGFGVIPAPIFRTEHVNLNPETGDPIIDPDTNQPEIIKEEYQTQIHVVGKGGAISKKTTKFSACTAFLQYQSTHSTEILNEYYNSNLRYDIADGVDGNVEMLEYIRNHVRTSFDKLYEDAIAMFYEAKDSGARNERWHAIIANEYFKLSNMAEKYATLYPKKAIRLEELESQYTTPGVLPE